MHSNNSEIERPVLKLIKSLLNTLNDAFTFSEDLRHIDDEKFQVPIEVSQKRITKILLILSMMLTFLASLLTVLIFVTFKEPNYNEITMLEGKF